MQSFKIIIEVSEISEARTLSGALTELVDPAPYALSMFEAPGGWRIDAYYLDAPDMEHLGHDLAGLVESVPPLRLETVPDENWVAISQAALPPVSAGRFLVHGSHDRGKIARGPNAIEIEAGEAFGTAHHATTQGCLLAIDRLSRRNRIDHVLDIGCGSGVLAIAAARALPRASIEATDNDPKAITVAVANARLNGVGRRIRFKVASGLPRRGMRCSVYDLVLANILASPLIKLAPSIARVTAHGGAVVLSGLLTTQAAQVSAAYLGNGFGLTAHHRLAGWSTLWLFKCRSSGTSRSCRPTPWA